MSIGSDHCLYPGCQKRRLDGILPAVYKLKHICQAASPFLEGRSCTTDWEVGKEYRQGMQSIGSLQSALGRALHCLEQSFSYRLSGQIVEGEASARRRFRSQVFPHQVVVI